MKYLIRAVKYFITLAIFLAVFLFALVILKVVDADPQMMFRNGLDSIWQIAVLLAVFSAIYPRFGYTSRDAIIPGEPAGVAADVREFMRNRGYVLEKQDGDDMSFILASGVSRFFRLYEDRITMTRCLSGYTVEGATKDVAKIVNGLRGFFNPEA